MPPQPELICTDWPANWRERIRERRGWLPGMCWRVYRKHGNPSPPLTGRTHNAASRRGGKVILFVLVLGQF